MKSRKNLARTMVEIVLVLALALGQQACGLSVGGLDCHDDNSCEPPPPEMSSPNSYTCACTCKTDSIDYEMAVKAGADDAEQNLATGAVGLAGNTLDMPMAGATEQLVGLRFSDLNIPKGAHIVSAQMQFTSATDASGIVTVSIVGEANDNAAVFASTAKNLSARQFTASSVPWALPDWKKDGQGPNQLTPSLEAIVQEIIDRPGWAPGNAIVLMIKKVSGAGTRAAYSFEGQPLNAPVLVVKYDDPAAVVIGPQAMPVCMPPKWNANIGGGNPQQDDLQNDCQYRVGPAFAGMAGACNYPTNCGCVAVSDTKTFAEKCDDPCVENPLAPDCSNFDPVHDKVEATNAPGDDPVCEANCPLSFNMFGRRSECQVEGIAFAQIGDDQASPAARGTVQFRGDPCPNGDCTLGMEYNLAIDDVRFETLFGGERFEELTGIGESIPGNEAVISRRGDGTFAPGDVESSVRGRLGREQQAMSGGNAAPIDFNVTFGADNPTCSLHAKLIGGGAETGPHHCQGSERVCTSDAQCAGDTSCPGGCKCVADDGSTVELGIDLAGRIVNQPPTADAGKDQIVQCPARVALDGSASSDLDGNIAVYTWMRGSRAGNKVGSGKVSEVKQQPGTESYVLRVIDARGQTDEDTTEVTVVDATAPQVSCSTRVAVFTQPTHALADVGLTGSAHDSCEGDLPVNVAVFSDEADDTSRVGGNLSPDGQSFALGSLKLRQERQSNGDGRVYLIRAAATDSSGNRGVGCCTVVVPQSSSRASLQAVQKQAAAAQSFCTAHQGAAPAGFFAVKDAAKTGPNR